MFGLKEKVKKPEVKEEIKEENIENTENNQDSADEVVPENDAVASQTVDSEPVPENLPEPATVAEPAIEQKQDKFDLAHMLGKTESGLKNDFYIYQIKELMAKLGKTINYKIVTVDEFAKTFKELKDLGVGEIAVSPFYYREFNEADKKINAINVKFGALIDYPNGESSFKAKIADVKEAVKNDVDTITVCMPSACVSLIRLSEEKARIIKLSRIAKRTFGVGIEASLSEESMKKVLKVIDNIKVKRIALLGEKLSNEALLEAVKRVSSAKGGKELCVYSMVDNVAFLSELTDSGADKVFTPFVEQIGKELKEKFDVEL